MREISEEEGASSINSSDVDCGGNIWLASTEQGVVKYSQGCFAPYAEDQFSGISLNAVAISGGRGYVGSTNGLALTGGPSGPEEEELIRLLDGVQVRDIMADSRGNIWIASYSGNPVVCYNPADGEIVSFSRESGLCNDRARVLAELQDGSVAVGTQGGLSIIAEGKIQESYTDFAYPTLLSLLEMPDGTLLAGSDGGGIYVLKDGGVTYEHPERVSVDSGAKRVDISYAVLSYSIASRFRTTYTSEGFDKGGNLADSDRNFVSYTNLRGGEYTFRLEVSDPNSGQSPVQLSAGKGEEALGAAPFLGRGHRADYHRRGGCGHAGL